MVSTWGEGHGRGGEGGSRPVASLRGSPSRVAFGGFPPHRPQAQGSLVGARDSAQPRMVTTGLLRARGLLRVLVTS